MSRRCWKNILLRLGYVAVVVVVMATIERFAVFLFVVMQERTPFFVVEGVLTFVDEAFVVVAVGQFVFNFGNPSDLFFVVVGDVT